MKNSQRQHIFVTGSTDGIGYLTALEFARLGHHVYIHGRSVEKVASTVSAVQKETGNQNIQGFVGDLSDMIQISQLSREIISKIDHIDVFINNAGVLKVQQEYASSGIDMRFMVNLLAPIYLTEQIIPILSKSSQPRIINLSSAAQTEVSLEVLRGSQDLDDMSAYAQSKLALTMWTKWLQDPYSGIESVAVNPGSLLNTSMVSEAFGSHRSPVSKGSNCLVDIALNYPEGYTDLYFDNDTGDFSRTHPDAYDADKIKELVSTCQDILQKITK